MIDQYIAALADYGVRTGLIEPADRTWAINSLLDVLQLQEYIEPEEKVELPLEEILRNLLDFSVQRRVIEGDITSRDLFDTKLMGVLTPRPSSQGGHGLVLPAQPGYRLYPPLPHRKGCQMDGPHGVWRSGYHHQPLQAGEGPQGHCRGQGGPPVRLPQVPAVPGERGLCRAHEPSGPGEPPDHPRHH